MKRIAFLGALIIAAGLPWSAARAQVSVSVSTPQFGIRVGAPVRPAPVYVPPAVVHVPVHTVPVYAPPVYAPPVYGPPVNRPPVYAAPAYRAPVVVPPRVVYVPVAPRDFYSPRPRVVYVPVAGSAVAVAPRKHKRNKHHRVSWPQHGWH